MFTLKAYDQACGNSAADLKAARDPFDPSPINRLAVMARGTQG